MAGIETVKDFVKPPFATYDIVVYFGCGLFALPFARRYLWGGTTEWLEFNFELKPDFANAVVVTLVLLFSVYIIGHIIAYVSSISIEKPVDAFFGKTSTVLLVASASQRGGANSVFRRQLLHGLKDSFRKSAWVSGLFRLVIHLPALLSYAIIIALGIFGFYRSRVPANVVEAVRAKFADIGFKRGDVAVDKPWFKSLEAHVMNNNPAATARMYNYLVISGLFRSVSLIFLAALWFETAYLLIRLFGGAAPLGLLTFGHDNTFGQFLSFSSVNLVYVFCLFSYLKFKRRYVEDAVFAFVFAR